MDSIKPGSRVYDPFDKKTGVVLAINEHLYGVFWALVEYEDGVKGWTYLDELDPLTEEEWRNYSNGDSRNIDRPQQQKTTFNRERSYTRRVKILGILLLGLAVGYMTANSYLGPVARDAGRANNHPGTDKVLGY